MGLATLAALTAGLLVVAALPSFGLRVLVVLSGSMEPAIAAGDAVVVREVPAEQVRVGDVITYRGFGSDRLTTHRVTEVRRVQGQLHFRTRGDANGSPDPNLAPGTGLQGRVARTLPGAGRVALGLQQPAVRLAGLSLPAAVLAGLAVRDLVAALRSRRTRAASGRRRPGWVLAPVAGTTLVVGVVSLAVASTLATFVERDTVDGNAFSTLAVVPPDQVTATFDCGDHPSAAGVTVGWDAVPDADRFTVLRSATAGGPYTVLATVTATSYSDVTVDNGTTYHYVVRTSVGTWSSASSAEASVTTPPASECPSACPSGRGGGGAGQGRPARCTSG